VVVVVVVVVELVVGAAVVVATVVTEAFASVCEPSAERPAQAVTISSAPTASANGCRVTPSR
jgi:hypothetical protein